MERGVSCTIRPFEKRDYERVLQICIDAFTPHHRLFQEALGDEIFQLRYHDWREEYAEHFSKLPGSDPAVKAYVVEEAGGLVGFVVTIMDDKTSIGEIGLNAIDPAHQGKGFGRTMYEFALADLKRRGAKAAYVGTGADAAHAPARAAYEAVGFDSTVPGIHYFRTL